MVAISHDWQKGIRRLLTAPRDLPEAISWREPPIQKAQASPRHRRLFEEYETSIDNAVHTALEWWEGKLQVKIDRGADLEAALGANYKETLAGPAAHPQVVWVIRRYWLACVALNVEVPETQRVPPEVFLLSWLMDGRHEELVKMLAGMPYWPIGMDRDGNWI